MNVDFFETTTPEEVYPHFAPIFNREVASHIGLEYCPDCNSAYQGETCPYCEAYNVS